ncbi:MAG: hypothetical protein IPP71_07730 [Bacteroidetes bacterium]|nr:hypothetical protein [Bacteroidota bacterium]
MLIETLLILLTAVVPYNHTTTSPVPTDKGKEQVIEAHQSELTPMLRGGWDGN